MIANQHSIIQVYPKSLLPNNAGLAPNLRSQEILTQIYNHACRIQNRNLLCFDTRTRTWIHDDYIHILKIYIDCMGIYGLSLFIFGSLFNFNQLYIQN